MIREILDTVDVEWCTQSITKAQRMYPSLSMFGLGKGDDFSTSQEAFIQISRCREFLRHCPRTKNINTNRSSYGYKHLVENWLCLFLKKYYSDDEKCPNFYISNGSFIVAAIGENFDTKRYDPNMYFNIGKIRDFPFAEETNSYKCKGTPTKFQIITETNRFAFQDPLEAYEHLYCLNQLSST